MRDVETSGNPPRTGVWTSLYQYLMFSSIFLCNWLSLHLVTSWKGLFSRMFRWIRVDTLWFGVSRREHRCCYSSDVRRCKICTQTACLCILNGEIARLQLYLPLNTFSQDALTLPFSGWTYYRRCAFMNTCKPRVVPYALTTGKSVIVANPTRVNIFDSELPLELYPAVLTLS